MTDQKVAVGGTGKNLLTLQYSIDVGAGPEPLQVEPIVIMDATDPTKRASVNGSGQVSVVDSEGAITPIAVTATAAGTAVCITPSSGKAIRLWWYNVGAHPSNTAPVLAGLRFGIGGTDFFKAALSQYGASASHSFKAGKSYYQGPVDTPLYINLNTAQTVLGNFDYQEI